MNEKVLCKNCGHKLKEIEVPDFCGNTHLIFVHEKQGLMKLPCEEECFCGCENSVKEAAKKQASEKK